MYGPNQETPESEERLWTVFVRTTGINGKCLGKVVYDGHTLFRDDHLVGPHLA